MKIYSKICRGILISLGLLLLGGLISILRINNTEALDNQTYDTDFFQNHYSSITTGVTSATHTVSGMGTNFLIYISTPNSTGPGALFQIAYSTYTTQPDTTGNFMKGGQVFMSSSTTGGIPANVLWPIKMWMEGPNPKLILSGMSINATAYVEIDYGQVRTNH